MYNLFSIMESILGVTFLAMQFFHYLYIFQLFALQEFCTSTKDYCPEATAVPGPPGM